MCSNEITRGHKTVNDNKIVDFATHGHTNQRLLHCWNSFFCDDTWWTSLSSAKIGTIQDLFCLLQGFNLLSSCLLSYIIVLHDVVTFCVDICFVLVKSLELVHSIHQICRCPTSSSYHCTCENHLRLQDRTTGIFNSCTSPIRSTSCFQLLGPAVA